MPTTQSQLIEVLKAQLVALEERVPGYRGKVAETLAGVIALEQKHRVRRIDIRQEVKRECLALGGFLAAGGVSSDTATLATKGPN